MSQAGRKRGQLENKAEIMSWQELAGAGMLSDPDPEECSDGHCQDEVFPHELLEEEKGKKIIWGMQAINLI